jgi:PPM family protein phosphatase
VVDPKAGLFLVADGIGGRPSPEVASRTVAELLRQGCLDIEHRLAMLDEDTAHDQRRDVALELASLIQRASERMFDMRQEHPSQMGMAASLILFKRVGRGGVIAHVGNGRAYLRRGGRLMRLTEDHTVAWEFIQRGILAEEDLPRFPYRNVVMRAVGELPTVTADTVVVDLSPGDDLLLTSKGLLLKVTEDEVKERLSGLDASRAAEELHSLATSRRTPNNVSLVVVHADGPASARDPSQEMTIEEKAYVLANHFLFRRLTFQEVVRFLRIVTEVRARPGDVVFKEGEAGNDFYVVAEGEVRISRRDTFLVAIGAGGHFGELSLILRPVRSATATASKPSRLLRIGRQDFEALLREAPAMTNKLLVCFLQLIGQRVRDLSSDYAEAKAKLED